MSDQNEPGLTLDDIDELGRAFQKSRLLLTAVQLDVFTAVARSSGTSADIAGLMGTDPRATEMLLNALTAVGLLRKESGAFACTSLPPGTWLPMRPRTRGRRFCTMLSCGTAGMT
jgi:predicted RNA-binding Zn ribbon-like protein